MGRDVPWRSICHAGGLDVPPLREQRSHDPREQVRGCLEHSLVRARTPVAAEAQAVEHVEQAALGGEVAPDHPRGVDRADDGVRRCCRDAHAVIVEEHLGLEPIRAQPHRRQSQPRARPSLLDRHAEIIGHLRERWCLRDERIDQRRPAAERHGDRSDAPECGEPGEGATVIDGRGVRSGEEHPVAEDEQRLRQRHLLARARERAVDHVRSGRLVATDRHLQAPRWTVIGAERQQIRPHLVARGGVGFCGHSQHAAARGAGLRHDLFHEDPAEPEARQLAKLAVSPAPVELRSGAQQPLEDLTVGAGRERPDVGGRHPRRSRLAPLAVRLQLTRHQVDDRLAGGK